MNKNETITFLCENSHTLMLWVGVDNLIDALKIMVSSQEYITQLSNFYGIRIIDVYWEYTQLEDDEQDYIERFANAKYNYIKMMAHKKK